MTNPNLNEAPKPDKAGKHVRWPLIANAGLMLMLYLVAAASAGSQRGNTALLYFFLLVGLLLLNTLAALAAFFFGKTKTAMSFLFSMLGIFLIGLGTCAYSLQNFHLDTR